MHASSLGHTALTPHCELLRPHVVPCTEVLNNDQRSHLTAAELSVYARALSLGVHRLPYVHINHCCMFVSLSAPPS
jgi:hypothetical protein